MTKPQQPEIARSGRSDVDPGAVKTRHGGPTDATAPTGPVPEDNQPGHHPEHEQDKPEGPPPRPRARGRQSAMQTTASSRMVEGGRVEGGRVEGGRVEGGRVEGRRVEGRQVEGTATATITDRRHTRKAAFRFRFDPRVAAAYLFGVTPWTTSLEVADGELRVRFGMWHVRTPLDNISDAEITGPYHWLKVAGPPRLSLRDRGVTMATSADRGVCIRFKEPVPALLPKGVLAHPALTVTVDDPDRLVEVLTAR